MSVHEIENNCNTTVSHATRLQTMPTPTPSSPMLQGCTRHNVVHYTIHHPCSRARHLVNASNNILQIIPTPPTTIIFFFVFSSSHLLSSHYKHTTNTPHHTTPHHTTPHHTTNTPHHKHTTPHHKHTTPHHKHTTPHHKHTTPHHKHTTPQTSNGPCAAEKQSARIAPRSKALPRF